MTRTRRGLGIATLTLTTSCAFAIATSLGACSSSSDASTPVTNDSGISPVLDAAADVPDADNGAPSTSYPAPHPDLPVVETFGGPVLTAPRVIPIFFPGDEYQSQIETYLHELASSGDWNATVSEYGAGPLTIAPSVVMAAAPAATVTDGDVAALAQQVALGTAATEQDGGAFDAGAPDQNSIYAVFYPTSTVISEGGGYDSCKSFGGYHAATTVTLPAGGTTKIVYTPVPRCPDFYAAEGLTGIDEVTAGLSHELAESATDPYSDTEAAYLAADYDHKVWGVVLAASETADMCSWEVPSTNKPAGIDFQTSRVWSNAAAKAGHDPCQPAPSDAYFATIPDLTETVTIPEYAQYGANGKIVMGGTTKGIKLAVGESKTIDLVLYSDGPTSGPWTVTPQEISSTPVLSFALDRDSGVNGERLHLTVTRNAKSPSQHGASFLLYSSIGAPKQNGRMSLAMVYVAD